MNAGFAAAAMALHTQLGVVLFERTGRGLVPTAIALQLA
jgi:DNA-binding transcriptional LysR family regulator